MVDIKSLSDDEQNRVRGLVEKGCMDLPNDAFDGLSEDACACITESMEGLVEQLMTCPIEYISKYINKNECNAASKQEEEEKQEMMI